jgi:hypothetical protein
MLVIEAKLPHREHKKLRDLMKKKGFKKILKGVIKSPKAGITTIFIENSPKGLWLALRILHRGNGKLYLLKEINPMDIPSRIIELSLESEWRANYSKIIKEELEKWEVDLK